MGGMYSGLGGDGGDGMVSRYGDLGGMASGIDGGMGGMYGGMGGGYGQ